MPGFNHERLAEIRTVRGMTMDQLAAVLGVTKQMVSKYEDGKSTPPVDSISKMAEIFSVPKKYLFKDSIYLAAGSSTLFLRAPLETTQKTRAYARIVSAWGYEITKAIDGVKSPFINLSVDEQLTIPEKAMEVRRQWGLGTQPIKNMVELLESQGFNIFAIDSPDLKTEAYSQIINGIPVIILNIGIGTSVRQRFSLAHELGHMILHRDLVDMEFDLRNKEIENEAQQFAEYFLLPVGGFDASFVSPKIDSYIALKKEWLVSISAMVFHSERTGLIDSLKRSSLQKQINTRGWKKCEPLDNEIEYEKPTAVGNRISQKVTDASTFSAFLDGVRLPIDKIENLCSMTNGTLLRFYDSSLEHLSPVESDQMGYEQISLFDFGGNYHA
ncbi:MAG: XRE family transcriptional regulator [Ruminiclostridium sp.]|nr:XRE family transcriptional regulator [Ruminiclostridium sp.]